MPFTFLTALPAQTTQVEADSIVLERMSGETPPYTIYAKDGVQAAGMIIETAAGEAIELDYTCWVYYYENANRYLIVNESNRNLLEINAKSDAAPGNLAAWRAIAVGKPIVPILIGKTYMGSMSNYDVPKQYLVITTSDDWDNLLTAVPSLRESLIETNIDFSNYQVIALIDQQYRNGGWTIDITDVTEYADEIVVTVENLQKGNALSVVTQPCHIVKIPRSAKNVRFQEIDIPMMDYSLESAGTACQWKNIDYDNKVIVINNSNEELGNYISCTNGGPHTVGPPMLLASGRTNYGISQISPKLQQLYPGKYTLNVEITLNNTPVTQEWCIALMVQRTLSEENIELIVTTKP